ncbi:MAG: PhoH family protein [Oscillospiraceae bacterium]|nr:PhoH family protein [Oscillospiraceae bacterium]
MIDRSIEVERMEHVISVFGSFDQNLRLIESELNVKILDRDNLIHITGEEENVMLAEKAIGGLLSLAARGENIDAQNVRYILGLVRSGKEGEIQKLAGDVICITAKGKPIKPKTIGQREYCDAIAKNTVTLGIGPAGTGKTYLAVAAAVAAFRAEKVNRIILTRPAVEAGERLGFLPGDLQSKVDPYLRPLYDALFDMLGPDTYQKYLERGNIEVAPLAYMRGRTLDDSFIILDEAQNTSREQMKMFLTRIGFGSKVVITGDITQIDLPEDKVSGLKVAMKVLEGIDDIAICTLTGADVVRHRLVQKIIEAYEVYEKRSGPEERPAAEHRTARTERAGKEENRARNRSQQRKEKPRPPQRRRPD